MLRRGRGTSGKDRASRPRRSCPRSTSASRRAATVKPAGEARRGRSWRRTTTPARAARAGRAPHARGHPRGPRRSSASWSAASRSIPGEQVTKLAASDRRSVIQRLRAECAWACLEHIANLLSPPASGSTSLLQQREYADFDDRLTDLWRPLLARGPWSPTPSRSRRASRHAASSSRPCRRPARSGTRRRQAGSTATLVRALLTIREPPGRAQPGPPRRQRSWKGEGRAARPGSGSGRRRSSPRLLNPLGLVRALRRVGSGRAVGVHPEPRCAPGPSGPVWRPGPRREAS